MVLGSTSRRWRRITGAPIVLATALLLLLLAAAEQGRVASASERDAVEATRVSGVGEVADGGGGGACSRAAIRDHVKTAGAGDPSAAACAYVRENCESDGLLDYAILYYCNVGTGWVKATAFFVAVVVGLSMLFRVLGTTADDYFAPTLTELSREIGLPPRFAGITFLALANGAPDVSSTIAAVRGGNYALSLGALTGAAMFVTCVVAGCVMVVGDGAKAKGALCREVSALFLVAASVLGLFRSGVVTKNHAVLFLVAYFAFCAIVLAADLWHRRRKVAAAATHTYQRLRSLSVVAAQTARAPGRAFRAGGGAGGAGGGGQPLVQPLADPSAGNFGRPRPMGRALETELSSSESLLASSAEASEGSDEEGGIGVGEGKGGK